MLLLFRKDACFATIQKSDFRDFSGRKVAVECVNFFPLKSIKINVECMITISTYIVILNVLGRSMWPIIVQYRCPQWGTNFSLYESIVFYMLGTNLSLPENRSFL